MSRSNIGQTMDRIASARSDSQIAVFYRRGSPFLNTVFAHTIATQGMIAAGHPDLIGCFDNSAPAALIKSQLEAVLKSDPEYEIYKEAHQ